MGNMYIIRFIANQVIYNMILKYKYEIYNYLPRTFQAGRFHANPANIAVVE